MDTFPLCAQPMHNYGTRCEILSPAVAIRTTPNLMHVTIKQLQDAAKSPRYQRRLVINNNQVYTVSPADAQICPFMS
jgi:hypothetical protein